MSDHMEFEDEVEDLVILAIDSVPSGKLGCAYYIARHQILGCMQDVEDGSKEVVDMLKIDIQPSILLVSARASSYVSERRAQYDSSAVNAVDDLPLPWNEILRPPSDFKYENAVSKVLSLQNLVSADCIRFLIPGENRDYDTAQATDELGLVDQQGRLLNITSSLELENRISVGCLGAVISYIQKRRASEYLQYDPQGDAAYGITRIEMFTLKNTMLLNNDALTSLQIIGSETHPSVGYQGPTATSAKESLSVFGLFHNFARTPQGKAKLRHMFVRPSLDETIISARHDLISVLIRSEHQTVCDDLSKSLSRIKNMQSTVTSLKKGIERGSQSSGTIRSGVWAALLEFCYHTIDIGDIVRQLADVCQHHILAAAEKVLDRASLQRLGKMIHDVVDLEESMEQHRTVIKRSVSQDLDRGKDAYNSMEDTLTQIATEITKTMPLHIQCRLNVIFLPQLGFHITVPLDEVTKQPVWDGDGLWERRFNTEKAIFFKNDRMKDMDVQWGDLYTIICDKEIDISHELAQRVLQNEEWLIEASEWCGELDSLLALTHGAMQYKLTRPRMVKENIIDIKGGRHILQEMTVAMYVPNDAFIEGGTCEKPSMMLLTGPNFSGKSVFLKQVALIVYMAQIGSFVPADSATLGITDSILTRINSIETVSKAQSAFMIDLQQTARALKACTNRSLLVIDEFGKGTDPCDGAGLAYGVLKYLLDLGSESPRVFASTHFHEVFERIKITQQPNFFAAHMEVHLNQGGPPKYSQHRDDVIYLYRLREGHSSMSFGTQCAALNGIPRRIIDRAMTLSDLIVRGEDLVAVCANLPRTELEELEEAENMCRIFLGKDLKQNMSDVRGMLEELDAPASTDTGIES